MLAFVDIIHAMLQSQLFYFLAIFGAFSVKFYLLSILIPKGMQSLSNKTSWYFLLGILAGSLTGDISWLIKMARHLFFPAIPYGLCVFAIRIAWAGMIVQYQSLALFIESLTKKNYRLNTLHKIMLSLSASFISYYLYLAFFENSLTTEFARNQVFLDTSLSGLPLEVKVMRYVSMYLLPLVIFPSLFLTFKNIKSEKLPTILKHQLTVLIKYLFCPFLIAEFIIAIQVNMHHIRIFETSLLSISTIIISYSIYYCIKKVLVLRFLNFDEELAATQRTNFINSFKDILEQLSKITSLQELSQVSQTLFKETFNIPQKKIHVIFRDGSSRVKLMNEAHERMAQLETTVEDFMRNHSGQVCEFIIKSKILIHDELAFSNFYQENEIYQAILMFLEKINAEIFIPLFQKNKIIAYIIIESHARPQKLYTSADRDEMIILTNYIGIIINLLQNRNLDMLIIQDKELKDDLYLVHQEIRQYKESISSCLRPHVSKEIGILFYKKGHFIYGNKAAQELVKVDLNILHGHRLTKALTDIADQVETFAIPRSTIITVDSIKLVARAMLNLEKNNVIITIYPPEITDIIKSQMHVLKNPQDWDYLLYLQTNKIGETINQMIPGTGETVLNSKLELLKFGLGRKALLIEAHEDDLQDLIELIHHMSLRTTLWTINLKDQVKNNDLITKLCGINPLLDSAPAEKPLLEKLDGHGTLFIQNIHLADLQTQEYLADYIKSGFFKMFKSDQKKPSNVRILCSSNQNVSLLAQEGKFSFNLYNQLKKGSFRMPSLMTLPENEMGELIDELMAQSINAHDFKNMLELTQKDKQKIIQQRPVSFYELKKKIKNMIILKSKKQNIDQEIQFQPATLSTDPDLVQAARLGKQALKDERTMIMLWNKFKNQNKIATFLGVNRSSVNRRFKDYNLD